jgi:hypothetical protein
MRRDFSMSSLSDPVSVHAKAGIKAEHATSLLGREISARLGKVVDAAACFLNRKQGGPGRRIDWSDGASSARLAPVPCLAGEAPAGCQSRALLRPRMPSRRLLLARRSVALSLRHRFMA